MSKKSFFLCFLCAINSQWDLTWLYGIHSFHQTLHKPMHAMQLRGVDLFMVAIITTSTHFFFLFSSAVGECLIHYPFFKILFFKFINIISNIHHCVVRCLSIFLGQVIILLLILLWKSWVTPFIMNVGIVYLHFPR